MNISAAASLARQRRNDLSAGVSRLNVLVDGLIKSTAGTLSVKESIIRSQVYRSANRLENKRGPSLWNGFMRTVADEANEGIDNYTIVFK